MNGYALSDYRDFEKKWHLVTVRFRHDKGELRFVYANDLANETLLSGKIDYPDGSVFAKIGRLTGEDPLFSSSAVPQKIQRYQFMVRNKVKNKDTDGWDYAIFDPQGNTLSEDPVAESKACFACHQIAASRGQVFSQAMSAFSQSLPTAPKWSAVDQANHFEQIKAATLPGKIHEKIPAKFTSVDSLQGAVREHLFQGTLEEIIPTLVKQVIQVHRPALLISRSGSEYSIVWSEKKSCTENGKIGQTFKVVRSVPPGIDRPGILLPLTMLVLS